MGRRVIGYRHHAVKLNGPPVKEYQFLIIYVQRDRPCIPSGSLLEHDRFRRVGQPPPLAYPAKKPHIADTGMDGDGHRQYGKHTDK
jgi:hypothetical protein